MKFPSDVHFTKDFLDILKTIEYQVKDKTILEKLKEEYLKASQKSITDKLTGIYNRRKFDEDLRHLYSQVDKHNGIHLSLIMIDLDDFKIINDEYGHDRGDMVLKWIAKVIKNCLRDRTYYRETTRVYRFGGEEFVILLSKTTPKTAYIVAERVRKMLEYKTQGKITASFGTSNSSDKDCIGYEKLVRLADNALYKAKQTGKNRIIVNDRHQFEFLHLNTDDIDDNNNNSLNLGNNE